MIGFLLRSLGFWLIAGAVVALVIDGSRSIAQQALSFAPLHQSWVTLSPQSYGTARRWVEANASAGVWSGVEWTLALPTWVVLLALGALLTLLGTRRRQRRVRFST